MARLLLPAGLLLWLACCCEAYDFYVGGGNGWVLKPAEKYNSWAERMRFQVDDKLVFKYKRGEDSVLVVKEEDYDSCNTNNPIAKFEDGDSVFNFDRLGPFFFISGASGHCAQGQKIIVVVLAVRNIPVAPPGHPPPCSPITPPQYFYVGGRIGWVLNPAENYNNWAERMRYQVDDKLVFKYKKGEDSVLLVKKEDYDSCNTNNPIAKYDGGNSVFTFDRSGPFFFISGASGHCAQGQKLIVVVLSVRNKPATHPPCSPITPPPSVSPSPAPISHPPTSSSSPTPAPKSPSSSPSPAPVAKPPITPPPSDSPTPAPISNPPSSSSSPAPAPKSPSSSPSAAPVAKPPITPPPSDSPTPAPISNPPSSSSSPAPAPKSPSSSPSPVPVAKPPAASPSPAPIATTPTSHPSPAPTISPLSPSPSPSSVNKPPASSPSPAPATNHPSPSPSPAPTTKSPSSSPAPSIISPVSSPVPSPATSISPSNSPSPSPPSTSPTTPASTPAASEVSPPPSVIPGGGSGTVPPSAITPNSSATPTPSSAQSLSVLRLSSYGILFFLGAAAVC